MNMAILLILCTILIFSIYEIIHFHILHTYLNNNLEMQLLFLLFPLKGCNLFYGRVFPLFDFSPFRCGKPLKKQLQFYGLNHKKATEQPLNFGFGEKAWKGNRSMEKAWKLLSLWDCCTSNPASEQQTGKAGAIFWG